MDGQKKAGLANGKEGQVEVDGVYQLYRSNLSKFFLKRDSPVPLGVFSRALVYPWPDAGLLLEPLIEYAFGPTILKNRKLQAVQLLTALFRNSTALSAVGQPLLTKRLHSLLQCSQRVITQKRKLLAGLPLSSLLFSRSIHSSIGLPTRSLPIPSVFPPRLCCVCANQRPMLTC